MRPGHILWFLWVVITIPVQVVIIIGKFIERLCTGRRLD